MDDIADKLAEALEKIVRHFEAIGFTANAPGHKHDTPGIWDDDMSNGDHAGTRCKWCAEWQDARAALAEYRAQNGGE